MWQIVSQVSIPRSPKGFLKMGHKSLSDWVSRFQTGFWRFPRLRNRKCTDLMCYLNVARKSQTCSTWICADSTTGRNIYPAVKIHTPLTTSTETDPGPYVGVQVRTVAGTEAHFRVKNDKRPRISHPRWRIGQLLIKQLPVERYLCLDDPGYSRSYFRYYARAETGRKPELHLTFSAPLRRPPAYIDPVEVISSDISTISLGHHSKMLEVMEYLWGLCTCLRHRGVNLVEGDPFPSPHILYFRSKLQC